MNLELIEQLKQMNIGKLETNVLLSKYTTYKVGGKAKVLAYPKNIEKLIFFIKSQSFFYTVKIITQ